MEKEVDKRFKAIEKRVKPVKPRGDEYPTLDDLAAQVTDLKARMTNQEEAHIMLRGTTPSGEEFDEQGQEIVNLENDGKQKYEFLMKDIAGIDERVAELENRQSKYELVSAWDEDKVSTFEFAISNIEKHHNHWCGLLEERVALLENIFKGLPCDVHDEGMDSLENRVIQDYQHVKELEERVASLEYRFEVIEVDHREWEEAFKAMLESVAKLDTDCKDNFGRDHITQHVANADLLDDHQRDIWFFKEQLDDIHESIKELWGMHLALVDEVKELKHKDVKIRNDGTPYHPGAGGC